MSNQSKGFTLIELMIVVVIIGILAALAIPRFMLAIDTSEAKLVLTSVKAAETEFHQEKGYYTDNLDSLVGYGFKLPDDPTCKYAITAEKGNITYTATAYRKGKLFYVVTPATSPEPLW